MEYCKLQIACLVIVLYIAFCYYRDIIRKKKWRKPIVFDGLLLGGIVYLFFDGVTAYTVNHLDTIPLAVNNLLQLCFLLSVDTFVFLSFLYILVITDGFPQTTRRKLMLYLPLFINLMVLLFTIDSVEYRVGAHSNYSMGFATLVESRDNNTGGHIRRTSMYAELLARELGRKGFYKDVLTKDYIKNLKLAAPMHDVGKIAIPDAVLQKTNNLIEEEYEIMKSHAVHGGRIIRETFDKLENPEYSI